VQCNYSSLQCLSKDHGFGYQYTKNCLLTLSSWFYMLCESSWLYFWSLCSCYHHQKFFHYWWHSYSCWFYQRYTSWWYQCTSRFSVGPSVSSFISTDAGLITNECGALSGHLNAVTAPSCLSSADSRCSHTIDIIDLHAAPFESSCTDFFIHVLILTNVILLQLTIVQN